MKYILLGQLSSEWIARQRERLQSVKSKAAELDITIDGIYYTQGEYDFVLMIRAVDPYVALTFSIWYAKQGYGRVTTMPAFDEASMQTAVERI